MPAKISFPNRSPAQGAGGRESWAGELHLRRAEGQAQNQGGPFRACVTHRLLDLSKLPRRTLLGFFLKTVFEGTQVWGFPGSTPQAEEAWPAARRAGEAPRREVTRARASPVVPSSDLMKLSVLLPLVSAVLLLLLVAASVFAWRTAKRQKNGERTWPRLGWRRAGRGRAGVPGARRCRAGDPS